MSIILDALKKAKKEAESEPVQKEKVDIENSNLEGGFFGGANKEPIIESESLIKNIKIIATKRNIILFSILILLLVIIFVFSFSKNDNKISSEKPVVRVVPPNNQSVQGTPPSGSGSLPAGEVSETLIQKNIIDAKQAFEKGDYDRSIELYRKAVEQKPDNAGLRNSLGLVFLKKGFFSSANTEFMKALELNDKCAECYNNFGYLKSVLGETFEAKSYLEKAISLSVSYPEPYFNMAVLYEKEGDVGNAVKFYRQFLEYYPNKDNELAYKVNTKIRVLTGK